MQLTYLPQIYRFSYLNDIGFSPAGGCTQLTKSRDGLCKAPVLFEIQGAALNSSKKKSAKSARTERIQRLI